MLSNKADAGAAVTAPKATVTAVAAAAAASFGDLHFQLPFMNRAGANADCPVRRKYNDPTRPGGPGKTSFRQIPRF